MSLAGRLYVFVPFLTECSLENLDMFLYRNIFSFILETELVENMVSVFVTFILL